MQRFNESTSQCEKFEELPCNLDGMPECSKTGKFLNIFDQRRSDGKFNFVSFGITELFCFIKLNAKATQNQLSIIYLILF